MILFVILFFSRSGPRGIHRRCAGRAAGELTWTPLDLLFRNPLPFRSSIAALTLLVIAVTVLSQAYGTGVLLGQKLHQGVGMTLCLCLAALAMDLVWGYCGILRPRPFRHFFGLGG